MRKAVADMAVRILPGLGDRSLEGTGQHIGIWGGKGNRTKDKHGLTCLPTLLKEKFIVSYKISTYPNPAYIGTHISSFFIDLGKSITPHPAP